MTKLEILKSLRKECEITQGHNIETAFGFLDWMKDHGLSAIDELIKAEEQSAAEVLEIERKAFEAGREGIYGSWTEWEHKYKTFEDYKAK